MAKKLATENFQKIASAQSTITPREVKISQTRQQILNGFRKKMKFNTLA